ncbi:MAG TPA: DUF2267 domain-containing protein [Sandaracinaceae bacterium]
MLTRNDDARADRIEGEIASAIPKDVPPECALAAVLGAVTRRMSRGEARRVVAALPGRHQAFLRRLTEERAERAEPLDRKDVLLAIASALGLDEHTSERVAEEVLAAVARALPQGLVRAALAQLPPDVAHLFRTPVEGPVAGPVPIRPRTVDAKVARDTVVDHPMIARLERMHAVPAGFTGASTFAAVACELARRLPRGEALHLCAALPEPVRALLEPCMAARDEEPEAYRRDDFLERVAASLEIDRTSAELVARAVFRVIHDALPERDVRHVESQLPEPLADVWRLEQTRLADVQEDVKPRRAAVRAARAGTARPR